MIEHDVSTQVVAQRIRNRQIEWLEMIVDYEIDHPPFDLSEALNQWEDWNPMSPAYPEPTYTPSEANYLAQVGSAWDEFCAVTTTVIANERLELEKPQWGRLVSAAGAALQELRIRGRLSEEQPIA